MLEASIEKLQVSFNAHVQNITQQLILGMDFLERFGVMLEYANGKAEVSMTGCRYPLSLCQEPLEASKKKTPEASPPEKLGQLLEVCYHKWKSLARHKGTEASVIWVRDTQAGAAGNCKGMDYKKLQVLAESNAVKPN